MNTPFVNITILLGGEPQWAVVNTDANTGVASGGTAGLVAPPSWGAYSQWPYKGVIWLDGWWDTESPEVKAMQAACALAGGEEELRTK